MSDEQNELPVVNPEETPRPESPVESSPNAVDTPVTTGVTAEILEIINISDAIKRQLSRVIVGQTDLMD